MKTKDAVLTVSAMTYSSPEQYIINLTDSELKQCLRELVVNENSCICEYEGIEDKITELAKIMGKDFKIGHAAIIQYIKNEVYREVARRWLNEKTK